MASIKPTTVPSKRLAQSITSADTSFKLNNILGWDAADLSSASFGTKLYCVFRNSAGTLMELMEIDPTTITDAASAINIVQRGLNFNGDYTTPVAANKLSWVKGDTIVELGTHIPQLLAHYVDVLSDQTIAGTKAFTNVPSAAADPVAGNDLVRKSYADALVLGTLTTLDIVVPGTADTTITAGQVIYLKTSNGRWALADSGASATSENVLLGIAQGAGTSGNPITNGVLLQGSDANQSGLSTGTLMYLSTSGAISSSAGTKKVVVGIAKDATHLYFAPRFDQQVTQDQIDAMAGNSGTPSSANRFVTENYITTLSPTGQVTMFAGVSAPTGWLLCDGSAVSRATYATLYALLNPTIGTFTVTLASPGVFSCTAHGLVEGDTVYLTTTGALPTGLAANTLYYVIAGGLTADAFELSATRGGSAINTSVSQSGVHTLHRTLYGLGNGSTTFNVPDFRGNVPVGVKPTDKDFSQGESGGEKTHTLTIGEMPSHHHTWDVGGGGASTSIGSSTANSQTKNTSDTGGDGAHNNLQPYLAIQYIIKT